MVRIGEGVEVAGKERGGKAAGDVVVQSVEMTRLAHPCFKMWRGKSPFPTTALLIVSNNTDEVGMDWISAGQS